MTFGTLQTQALRAINGPECRCVVYVDWARDGHWREETTYVCRWCRGQLATRLLG